MNATSMKDLLGDTPVAYARRSDPRPSHEAAALIGPKSKLMLLVLGTIRECGDYGATWDELAVSTGVDKGSISPRFKQLCDRNLIKKARDGNGDLIRRAAPGKTVRQTVWVRA